MDDASTGTSCFGGPRPPLYIAIFVCMVSQNGVKQVGIRVRRRGGETQAPARGAQTSLPALAVLSGRLLRSFDDSPLSADNFGGSVAKFLNTI